MTAEEGYLNTNAHLETKVAMLERALAESQSRELRLREALRRCRFDSLNMSAADWEFIRTIYAEKSDDSAMREMIAAEREACAAVCDARYQFIGDGADHAIDECAKAIRARNG